MQCCECIDVGVVVNFIVSYICIMLCVLIYCVDVWQNMWCDFGGQMYFFMIVKDVNFIVICDIVFLCIEWIYLYFLVIGGLQNINIVVV